MSLESYLEILKNDDFNNRPRQVVFMKDGKTYKWVDEFSGSLRTQVYFTSLCFIRF